MKASDIEGNVMAPVAGALREMAHPSLQVNGYKEMFESLYEVFSNDPCILLSACVYCHNYNPQSDDPLQTTVDSEVLKLAPVFKKHDIQALATYLQERLSGGNGSLVYERFNNSAIKPSKRLIQEFKNMRKSGDIFQSRFALMDDQLAARNAIIHSVKKAAKQSQKSVVIVNGGPGTGKSVIALESMIELMNLGKVVFYASGGGAMTETLRSIAGNKAKHFFKYFYSFTKHEESSIDIIICDEAHRLKIHSNDWGVPYMFKSKNSQVEDIIRAAKVSVFFVDEMQVIRPNEIGSKEHIKQAAEKISAQIHEYTLTTQFRCSGSDRYLQWIENALNLIDTDYKLLDKNEPMQFQIIDSPSMLKEIIDEKNSLKQNCARIVAGYCWPWSDPLPDGSLANDVVIGDFSMPWEAKWGKKHSKEVPDAALWATDPKGVSQIGTVYTSQGLEFDYIGVIFGEDLVYRKDQGGWVGQQEKSYDKALKRKNTDFVRYIKNIYRVLLSRAHFGAFVYFVDKETKEYFQSLLGKGRI